MADVKSLTNKLVVVASAISSPIISLLFGYVSDLILAAYNSQDADLKKIVRVVGLVIREYQEELGTLVTKTDTPYDDKLLKEVLEAMDSILA